MPFAMTSSWPSASDVCEIVAVSATLLQMVSSGGVWTLGPRLLFVELTTVRALHKVLHRHVFSLYEIAHPDSPDRARSEFSMFRTEAGRIIERAPSVLQTRSDLYS